MLLSLISVSVRQSPGPAEHQAPVYAAVPYRVESQRNRWFSSAAFGVWMCPPWRRVTEKKGQVVKECRADDPKGPWAQRERKPDTVHTRGFLALSQVSSRNLETPQVAVRTYGVCWRSVPNLEVIRVGASFPAEISGRWG